MPITDRLVHSLVIVTPTTTGSLDDYGHPVAGEPVTASVSGLVQPRSVREIALASQSGAEIGDHVVFLSLGDYTNAAYIRFDPDDGVRYDILGIRRFEYGTVNDHLEVDCRRVVSEALTVVSS